MKLYCDAKVLKAFAFHYKKVVELSEVVEVKDEDGEMVGVTARNTYFMKFYGLTREEYDDVCRLIKDQFQGKGYLYLREANRIFLESMYEAKYNKLLAENEELKKKIEEDKKSKTPKTMGGGI